MLIFSGFESVKMRTKHPVKNVNLFVSRSLLLIQSNLLYMKKLLAICLFVAAFSVSNLSAQNLDYRHTASLNVGQSTLGLLAEFGEELLKARFENDESVVNIGAIDINASPVFEGTYDFAIKEWFSLGVVGANQNFSVAYTDFEFINEQQDFVNIEGFTGNMNRFNLTLRPNFHYRNRGRLDMYSGLRLGVSIYTFSADSDIPFTQFAKFGGPLPSLGLTVFGIRYFVTENIGLGGELNVGEPYFAKIGVAGRF